MLYIAARVRDDGTGPMPVLDVTSVAQTVESACWLLHPDKTDEAAFVFAVWHWTEPGLPDGVRAWVTGRPADSLYVLGGNRVQDADSRTLRWLNEEIASRA